MKTDVRARPLLGIAMPVFNEERWLDAVFERVLARPECLQLAAVDDGSSDGSWEKLERWRRKDRRVKTARHERNRGKGAAVRTALQHLDAPLILIQDADLEYQPEDYPKLLAPIWEGRADAVYGSRFFQNSQVKENPRWHTLGNRLLTWISNRLTGLRLSDEATCYKLFKREALERIDLIEDGFEFCPEVTAKLAKLVREGEIRLVEVPIGYRGRTSKEGKKIRIRDGARALKSLWKHSR